ncbi:Pyridoxamine 5'-phosphate oxidase [Nesidiocoris tenuis]|uniref:pyridoxal 5'-phosphate synthase n=1 Tax=Nesidiocoris tenuis TaxID=355587 RepID=A0ABN7ASC4_9HEMI|nr:Pyridoxamine 5'-phosphate oxidase [Nesidiocoris tenuis]
MAPVRIINPSYPLDKKSDETGIFKFPTIPNNPFTMFRNWYEDHKTENHIATNAFCLSTATKEGKVSSRNLILRRLDDDGFVLMTDNRSKKAREMRENPQVAASFLWVKLVENGLIHARQVRMEGAVEELPYDNWKELYEAEPLFCKIRSHVCHQGTPVEWDALKEHHDKLLQGWKEGVEQLNKPDHVVCYKIFPSMIEFYESKGPRIADRVMYLKEAKSGWSNQRIAA